MGFVKEIAAGLRLKAPGQSNALPFPDPWGRGLFLPNQRHRINYQKVGDGLANSASFAVVQALGRAYAEPTIGEWEYIDGAWERLPESPVAELIANPNPYMEDDLLWLYSVAAISATGSAYIHKVRNLIGEVIQLWPLYPAYVKPHTPTDGSQFLDYWEYSVPSKPMVKLPPQDVIQLRWGVDRDDHRLGWSPLKNVLSEILQDDEAAAFSTSLLINLGVPGVVLSPRDPLDPGPTDTEAVAKSFSAKFTGGKRGEPFVMSKALRVDMVSFNPQQMDLTALRRVPEERISGALGWPAILAGLGVGLENATYSNVDGLREFATEQTLVPLWRLGGKQMTRQLLYDVEQDPKRQLRFDLTEVRALQKDEDATVNRLNVAIGGGWATVAEGRREIGLPIEDQHNVFLRGISTIPVGFDADPIEEIEEDDDAGAE